MSWWLMSTYDHSWGPFYVPGKAEAHSQNLIQKLTLIDRLFVDYTLNGITW